MPRLAQQIGCRVAVESLTNLVTPSALAKRIESVAAYADAVEESLTKQDRR